jgi:hypothetical protein
MTIAIDDIIALCGRRFINMPLMLQHCLPNWRLEEPYDGTLATFLSEQRSALWATTPEAVGSMSDRFGSTAAGRV